MGKTKVDQLTNNDGNTNANTNLVAVNKPPKGKRKADKSNIALVNNSKKQKKLKPNEAITPAITNEDEPEPEAKSDDDGDDEVMPLLLPSKRDLKRLIDRIAAAIPANDAAAYKTRAKKINWDEIAFDDYSADKCRDTWLEIQKHQRHFRHFGEVLADARSWIKQPVTQNSPHPELPKRPLSSYMLFYLDRKDALLAANPGIKMTQLSCLIAQQYNELEEAVRDRYVQMAAKRRQDYEVELDEFYEKHPEISRNGDDVNKKSLLGTKKKKKPPRTPFGLYYADRVRDANANTAISKVDCKADWKRMTEAEKLIWINSALELNKGNESNENNQFKRDILTKEEKQLKERMDGKPEKPPNSAYSLYSRIQLKSDELKDVGSKERMKMLALRWKDIPEAEKETYKDRVGVLMEQYKQDYANYLESLPDDKREVELKSSASTSSAAMSSVSSAKRKNVAKPLSAEQTATAKKIKKENCNDDADDEEVEDKIDINNLMSVAIPETWNDMQEGEKAMYIKYIQKIKDYFDVQHRSALKITNASSASSTTDSQSDSEVSSSD